jgi:hypothetical protein
MRDHIRKKILFNKRADHLQIYYNEPVSAKHWNHETRDARELKIVDSLLFYENVRRR